MIARQRFLYFIFIYLFADSPVWQLFLTWRLSGLATHQFGNLTVYSLARELSPLKKGEVSVCLITLSLPVRIRLF